MPDGDMNSFNIRGGDLYLTVGSNQARFRIHSHFLIRESEWWKKELLGPESSADAPLKKGISFNSPHHLRDVSPEDFRHFLAVFYNNLYDNYAHVTTAQWMVILRCALKWEFKEVEALAMRWLDNQDMNIAERIVLYQRNKVPRRHLLPLYVTLVSRPEAPDLEECRVLGHKNLWFLNHAQRDLYAKRLSSQSGGGPDDLDNKEIAKIVVNAYGKTIKNTDPTSDGD
ncbi:hypothetical protein AGABI1DRAFT_112968 [Agaricus bisporus var. burnettii JB137-S8]|uniref:BTB domain-containing protein n=1 Tax=Agaricus bisporus var. burnettii (strain JB137-S8 / ATCC MYA-4627 / FGSC 10392) TaxID=597362 RepID=K5W3D0_AGABU|nr:uncharacterized protein AGABI1DRAFT_112968 [Agaricus bisporus var. burnettii JB137-S8]EKM81304.1 hypothetical protein AGABI1DRAFT_112968 [Agaricus bisporus var. burnettii JB137-S8]